MAASQQLVKSRAGPYKSHIICTTAIAIHGNLNIGTGTGTSWAKMNSFKKSSIWQFHINRSHAAPAKPPPLFTNGQQVSFGKIKLQPPPRLLKKFLNSDADGPFTIRGYSSFESQKRLSYSEFNLSFPF